MTSVRDGCVCRGAGAVLALFMYWINTRLRREWVITLLLTSALLAVPLGLYERIEDPTLRKVGEWMFFSLTANIAFCAVMWVLHKRDTYAMTKQYLDSGEQILLQRGPTTIDTFMWNSAARGYLSGKAAALEFAERGTMTEGSWFEAKWRRPSTRLQKIPWPD